MSISYFLYSRITLNKFHLLLPELLPIFLPVLPLITFLNSNLLNSISSFELYYKLFS